jgi:hypothetical protein
MDDLLGTDDVQTTYWGQATYWGQVKFRSQQRLLGTVNDRFYGDRRERRRSLACLHRGKAPGDWKGDRR